MRFLGLGLADPVPDATTIWTFREALKSKIRSRPSMEEGFSFLKSGTNIQKF